MSEPKSPLAEASQKKVDLSRASGDVKALAESLEELASALLKEVDIHRAADALEEAAGLWSEMQCGERLGKCLLLAASSRRLIGDLDAAKQNLVSALAADIPQKLKNGFEMEWCEQELAGGRSDTAYKGFTRVLDKLSEELPPVQQAQIYQRRAAAAVAGKRWFKAAEDFLHTSKIFEQQGLNADAEAAALAAAAVLADVDANSAEQIVSRLSKNIPSDAATAIRRGLVGGKVAMEINNAALALKRFDEARQGALDMVDTVSYLTASISASRAAQCLGDFETAYGRLATAWASLSDILGADMARQMVQPVLEELRSQLGAESFAAAKKQYEKKLTDQRSIGINGGHSPA